MTMSTAIAELKRGRTLQCMTREGTRFELQPKVSDGLFWYRVRPMRRGCLNRYSRLSDAELEQWLGVLRVERNEHGK